MGLSDLSLERMMKVFATWKIFLHVFIFHMSTNLEKERGNLST